MENKKEILKRISRFLVWARLGQGEGNGNPPQYSRLENPMDGGAWQGAVHGVSKSRTWLSNFTFNFPFMYWRRKWQPTAVFLPRESQGREPGGLPSMGSHRVRHDWSDLAAAAADWGRARLEGQKFASTHIKLKISLLHNQVETPWKQLPKMLRRRGGPVKKMRTASEEGQKSRCRILEGS